MHAQDSFSLAEYVDRARETGINIIYASNLVPTSLRVAGPEPLEFSLDTLRALLVVQSLQLEAISPGNFLVKRGTPSPKVTAANAQASQPARLEEVVVSSSLYQWLRRDPGPALSLDEEQLSLRAVAANDALRAVNQLPGSASVGVSARPRVRGGNEDETLIEFDGVRLYNPFHFSAYNSLFSAFDSRLLGQIDFYSGAFPLRFGDRLSATMALEPRSPQELGDRRELGLGTLQVSYLQSVQRDDRHFLVSARRSGAETGQFTDMQDLGHPEFGDVYVRYGGESEDGSNWTFNMLWFSDDIVLNSADGSEQAESNDSSAYLWARRESDSDSALHVQSSVGVGRVARERSGGIQQPDKVVATLDDSQTLSLLFANQDFDLVRDDRILRFGWDYRYLSADFDYSSTQEVAPAFASLSNINRESEESYRGEGIGQQGALYGSVKQGWGKRWFIEGSLRLDAQRYSGEELESQLSYRAALLYQLSDVTDLRFVWGRYAQSQGVHELRVADLETRYQPAQSADHLVLSVERQIPFLGMSVRIEGYSKRAMDINAYYDNLANAFTLLPELQPDRVRVDATSYQTQGLELALNGQFPMGNWWANISAATSEDRVDGVDVRRRWDQSRTANMGFQLALGLWRMGLSATVHEGWLTTPLEYRDGLVVAGARNSQRFDHYASLDLKVVRHWPTSSGEVRLEAGVSNLTDRENEVGVDVRVRDEQLQQQAFYGIPRAVFFDLYWRF